MTTASKIKILVRVLLENGFCIMRLVKNSTVIDIRRKTNISNCFSVKTVTKKGGTLDYNLYFGQILGLCWLYLAF